MDPGTEVVASENLQHSIILFDGFCNLCNSTVNFIIGRDHDIKFKFAALQSEKGKAVIASNNIDPEYSKSILLITDKNVFKKSRAILEIVKRSQGLWKLFYVFRIIPIPVLDIIYDLVAKYRYGVFGKREQCRMPTPELMKHFL